MTRFQRDRHIADVTMDRRQRMLDVVWGCVLAALLVVGLAATCTGCGDNAEPSRAPAHLACPVPVVSHQPCADVDAAGVPLTVCSDGSGAPWVHGDCLWAPVPGGVAVHCITAACP